MTFKVHSDQRENIEAAIKKMKKVCGTDVNTVALANVCADFLGGSPLNEMIGLTDKQLRAQMKAAGLQKVMDLIKEVWAGVEVNYEVPEGVDIGPTAEENEE
jgi:hypothetical protein